MIKNNPFIREDRNYSINNIELFPWQNEGVKFILSNFNCIINFQPGLGKTLLSLVATQHFLKASSTLQIAILAPKQAISSFKKELSTKVCESYSIYTTDEYEVHKGDRYHIFTYTKVEELIKFTYSTNNPICLVVDECHKLSNNNLTNKQLFQLRNRFCIVIGLSGTPLQDKVETLYNVVNFVRPGYLGSYKDYEAKYLVTKMKNVYVKGGKKRKFKDVVGTKNTKELSEKLKKIMCIQFRSYNLDFQYRSTSMNKYERECYVEASKGMIDILDNEKEFSARLVDLQRVVDGCHESFEIEELSSKEKLLISTLSEIMNRNESVLIYCSFESTYTRLVKVLEKYQYLLNYSKIHLITGKIKFEDRVKVESDMPNKTIVIITKAGTASINLQKANNLIFYDTPFTLLDVIQAIGRICRADTSYEVQRVYFLEVRDTIDTYKRKVVESKIKNVQNLFGSNPTLPQIKDEKIDKEQLKKSLLWKKY